MAKRQIHCFRIYAEDPTPLAGNVALFAVCQGRKQVARKVVLVSDISGKEIADGQGATLTISYHDARRGIVKLDVNENEVADLAGKGQKQARRGRPPKKS